ncbi:hypothetical protein ACQ4LE_000715 [Meloidogyne hapla]
MTWESPLQRNDWANNLKIFQLMKNNRFHKSLKKTPYEAVFGRKPHSLPSIISMEDEQIEDEDYMSNFSSEMFDVALENSVEVVTDENRIDANQPEIAARQQKIAAYREYIQEVQMKRAEEMTKATQDRLGQAEVGRTVRVPIDPVDRGKVDPRNILAVVMENNNGYYKLGTESGVLPHKFVRSGFTVAKSDHLGLDDVPTFSVSLRTAAKASSQHEGQGFKHCNCSVMGIGAVVIKKEGCVKVDVIKASLAQTNEFFNYIFFKFCFVIFCFNLSVFLL